MKRLNRRQFLAATAGATAGLSQLGYLGRALGSEEGGGRVVPRPPQVPLGKTGITLSRVGQGTGMHGGNRQSDHTRMGFEKLVALLQHGYERGVTFFDLADLYGSHVYCREALRSIPREKVTILTKLWWRYDGNPAETPAEHQRRSARMALERFRHEISTDYLDIVLLHCLSTPRWVDELAPYMEVLDEAKGRKKVRAVGVSCHNLDALKEAVKHPWVDVILARINLAGAKMDGPPEAVVPVLREAKQNGKAIIGMKVYGEGTLAEKKEECIRYVQNLGLLDCMTVGAMTPEQMDETLSLVAKYAAAKV